MLSWLSMYLCVSQGNSASSPDLSGSSHNHTQDQAQDKLEEPSTISTSRGDKDKRALSREGSTSDHEHSSPRPQERLLSVKPPPIPAIIEMLTIASDEKDNDNASAVNKFKSSKDDLSVSVSKVEEPRPVVPAADQKSEETQQADQEILDVVGPSTTTSSSNTKVDEQLLPSPPPPPSVEKGDTPSPSVAPTTDPVVEEHSVGTEKSVPALSHEDVEHSNKSLVVVSEARIAEWSNFAAEARARSTVRFSLSCGLLSLSCSPSLCVYCILYIIFTRQCWEHFDFGMLELWHREAAMFCGEEGDTTRSWLRCRVTTDGHLPPATAPHTMCDGGNIYLDIQALSVEHVFLCYYNYSLCSSLCPAVSVPCFATILQMRLSLDLLLLSEWCIVRRM